VLGLALALSGCRSEARQAAQTAGGAAAQAAVPAAMNGLRVLDQPENQAALQRIVHSPAVQDAVSCLAAATVRGMVGVLGANSSDAASNKTFLAAAGVLAILFFLYALLFLIGLFALTRSLGRIAPNKSAKR
jgi:hypothetical protein